MNAERRSPAADEIQRSAFDVQRSAFLPPAPGEFPLPGTVVAYRPPATGLFLGSPSLIRCADGSLLTSHDEFGPGSSDNRSAQTYLYRSRDNGRTWTRLGAMRDLTVPGPDDTGLFWNSFFRRDTELFSIGAAASGGDLVIRRSTDHGATWTRAAVGRGRLIAATDGRTHASGPMTVPFAGRIWTAVEHPLSPTFGDTRIAVLAADARADLLDPSAWRPSNGLSRDPGWLDGTFSGWLEGCPVPTREGGLVVMLRVDNRYPNGAAIGMKAAIVRVHPGPAGTAPAISFSGGTFDPTDPTGSGFVDFPGGCVRFIVRYDPPSDRYWSVCSYIPEAYRNARYNAERFRGILVLVSSSDLAHWTVERTVVADERLLADDPAGRASAFDGPFGGGFYHTRHGFQYPFFLIEGDDLLVTIRTAITDSTGGPRAGHDANYYVFRRVENFRTRQADQGSRAKG